MILAFLEQQALYDSVDFRLPAWGQAVVNTPVDALRCPTDPDLEDIAESHNLAVTNYVASEGYHWWAGTVGVGNSAPWNGSGANASYPGFSDGFTDNAGLLGVFTNLESTQISDIKDGTSNTVSIAESNASGFYGGRLWSIGTGKKRYPGVFIFAPAFVADGHGGWGGNEANASGILNPDGTAQTPSSHFRNNPYTGPPVFMSYRGFNSESYHGAGSLHPGGMHVCLVDGSTRFVVDSLDFGTWLKLNAIRDRHSMAEF